MKALHSKVDLFLTGGWTRVYDEFRLFRLVQHLWQFKLFKHTVYNII